MSQLLNPNGLWEVSTEGDCEGKSIKHLGTYQGSVLDIAKRLRGQEFYQLSFKEVKTSPNPVLTEKQCKKSSVHFSVEGLSKEALAKELKGLVKESNFYGAVKLELSQKEILEEERRIALSKLSDKEKELLGVK